MALVQGDKSFGEYVEALLIEHEHASNPDWNVTTILLAEFGEDDATELLVAMIRVMLAKRE